MTLILGIDPGSRATGFGVIAQVGGKLRHVAHGVIKVQSADIPSRLGEIFNGLALLTGEHDLDEVAIEQVFMARNADSALKLGQARGAAISAVVQARLPVFEYSARQVKQALVGSGAAQKAQVSKMVCYLLALDASPPEDAADALGIAICHAHMRVSLARMAGATAIRRGRVR